MSEEKPEQPAFESLLEELQTLVEKLESGQLPLEDSLKLYERGVELSRLGSARLDDAEARVEVLQQNLRGDA